MDNNENWQGISSLPYERYFVWVEMIFPWKNSFWRSCECDSSSSVCLPREPLNLHTKLAQYSIPRRRPSRLNQSSHFLSKESPRNLNFLTHLSYKIPPLLWKRNTWVQGCIFRLTCSHRELTTDHVLISAYINFFRTVTRNSVNKSVWRKRDCFWLPLNKREMRKQSANSVFLPRFCFKFDTPKMSGNSEIWTRKKMDIYFKYRCIMSTKGILAEQKSYGF